MCDPWMARPGQMLHDHHCNTAELCRRYTEKFGCPAWGKLLGGSHDWGKGTQAWLDYLMQQGPRVPHAYEAAAELIRRYPQIGRLMAYPVAGHHTGLPDWYAKLDQWETYRIPGDYAPVCIADKALDAVLVRELTPFVPHPESLHLWVRMIFSALVDADRSDAAAASGQISATGGASFANLEERFRQYLHNLTEKAPDTQVNRRRNAIREAAEERAALPPGFFSLYVPTGAGKTLTAMAFALQHRKHHQLDRIIMAIPFCSIIEQTAEIYKDIFGVEHVLEHHSAFDPESPDLPLPQQQQYALAAENWDMPVIVTTNVQLFESLFASRAAAARKLHRIARSILILDEVQMLPRGYLRPVLSVLHSLVRDFGCTVVLCSATLPPLAGASIGPNCPGLPPLTPLADNPEELARLWSRVRLSRIGRQSTEELAGQLAQNAQVLCIVNTKRQCRRLYEALDHQYKVHLSAAMCPEDRSRKIRDIRNRLTQGLPVAVIATQVVEAGVDFDFPRVYREMAGWDSVAQAAGRCNREGRLPWGELILFESEQLPPRGLITQAAAISRQLEDAQLTPESFEEYFRHLYQANLDTADFTRLLVDEATRMRFEFATFARNFKWIENDWESPVVVWYGDGWDRIEELRRSGPSRSLLRRLQRFTVNAPTQKLELELAAGTVAKVHGIYVQNTENFYDNNTGIQLDTDAFLCG